MLLPFDQNNPKIRVIVIVVTIAFLACALWVVYRSMVPRWGGGIEQDFPTSTGFVLADTLVKQIGTGGIVVVVNASRDASGAVVRSNLGESQMLGVKAALRDHSGISIIEEVDLLPPVMPGLPGTLNLILPEDLARIIASHPNADGILLLAGLPRVIPRIGTSAPPIAAFDPTGMAYDAWIRSKAAMAVAIWNFSDQPQVPPADVDARAVPFYKEGILITPENIDSLNAAPSES